MSDEEWGAWTEHDGKGCPCVGAVVYVRFDRASQIEANPMMKLVDGGWSAVGRAGGGPSWFYGQADCSIIRYRIRKPRALLDMIERARELDNAPEGPVRIPASPKVTVD